MGLRTPMGLRSPMGMSTPMGTAGIPFPKLIGTQRRVESNKLISDWTCGRVVEKQATVDPGWKFL